jgi:hypothetical protein
VYRIFFLLKEQFVPDMNEVMLNGEQFRSSTCTVMHVLMLLERFHRFLHFFRKQSERRARGHRTENTRVKNRHRICRSKGIQVGQEEKAGSSGSEASRTEDNTTGKRG